MAILHLIEKRVFPDNLQCLDKQNDAWESGFWVVAADTAQQLVGGMICLHDAQDKRSYFGGEILGYRMVTGDDKKPRAVFRFRATREARDVRAGPANWGQEKKIVW